MQPFFQKEWFGIPLKEVGPLSIVKMPDEGFYQSFYGILYDRFDCIEKLPPHWRAEKKQLAALLAQELGEGEITALSLGCGLGLVEGELLRLKPQIRLDLSDLSSLAMNWIRQQLPTQGFYIGQFPQCIPADRKFRVIFCNNLDYAMDSDSYFDLLKAVHGKLEPEGQFIVMSNSHTEVGFAKTWARRWRSGLVSALGRRGWLKTWQLWGWYRSSQEHKRLLHSAGFSKVECRLERLSSGQKFLVVKAC